MSEEIQQEYVKPREVALYFGVSEAAIYKWATQGRIRSRKLGRRLLISLQEFEYVKEHGLREIQQNDDQKNRKPLWA